MSTQAVTISVSGIRGGRSMSVTSTDSTWNNQATTVTGGAQLGFALTGRVINCVQCSYAGGNLAWRIRNRVTQQTLAFGFGAKAGSAGGAADTISGGSFPGVSIPQDAVLEVITEAVA